MKIRAIEELADILPKYDYTACLARGNWAWEFARRNDQLRREAYASNPDLGESRATCADIKLLDLRQIQKAAEAWGLIFFPDPGLSALTTDVFWLNRTYPRKVTVTVSERAPGEIDEIFEKTTRLCDLTHLVDAHGDEHILVKSRKCTIQVRCKGRSLLDLEPVRMDYSFDDSDNMKERFASLDRAKRVYGDDQTGPVIWSRKGLGFRNALIALDANEAGMSYRDTAMIFYDEARVTEDWVSCTPPLKSEMARLLSKGRKLRDGGYRKLLEEKL